MTPIIRTGSRRDRMQRMSGDSWPARRRRFAHASLRSTLALRLAACLLVVITSGVSALSALVIEEGGCGALCRRTCCKPTNCLVLRSTCCCTDRAPGPATVGPSDEALPAPGARLAIDLSPDAFVERLVTRLAACQRSVPHPPPRA